MMMDDFRLQVEYDKDVGELYCKSSTKTTGCVYTIRTQDAIIKAIADYIRNEMTDSQLR